MNRTQLLTDVGVNLSVNHCCWLWLTRF